MIDTKIYKQTLQLTEMQTIGLPKGSRIMYFNIQNDTICMWYEFELALENSVPDVFHFYIIGTGNVFQKSDDMKYCTSLIMGTYVWHIYLKRVL